MKFGSANARGQKMINKAPEAEREDEESDFKPLSAEEAQAWRQRHPPQSLWWVVVGQVLAGLVITVLAAVFFGTASVTWSAGYGALAVVLPAALFARGVARSGGQANTAVARFFVWELAKLALTIAMLAAAPRVVTDLNWLALLAGMVVTMKTYWIALKWRSGVRKTD